MEILFDTSILVEIDRKNKLVIDLAKKLISENHSLIISTITVSEILTGSYLRKDFKTAVGNAKTILGQFKWIDFDASIAEKTAKFLAYLIVQDRRIEYQDVAIAATFSVIGSEFLLTLNKKDFNSMPDLEGKVFSPEEFLTEHSEFR